MSFLILWKYSDIEKKGYVFLKSITLKKIIIIFHFDKIQII